MPVWLLTVLGSLGGIAIKMLTQLATEKVLKGLIITALEKVVAKTESADDDKLLQTVKEAWGVE